MKGWLINNDGVLTLKDVTPQEQLQTNDDSSNNALVRVKMSKSIISFDDVYLFASKSPKINMVLGSTGIGIIMNEVVDSAYSLEKGSRVFINPYRICNDCFPCRSGIKTGCANLKIAGDDFDGYLREFVDATENALIPIPDTVSDTEALYVDTVARSLNIIDKMNIQKGEHVVILGATNFGIILAQILKYYQSIPIIIDNDETRIKLARECGIYYSLAKDKDWLNEVSDITGGRLAPQVVFLQNSKIPLKYAFTLAGYNAQIAISGLETKGTNVLSFSPAIKKELKFFFINTGLGNLEASINLIANKAIDFSKLPIATANFDECDKVMNELADKLNNDEQINETIINVF